MRNVVKRSSFLFMPVFKLFCFALDVGNHVALLHVRTLLGINFYQFAAKRSGELKDLTVGVFNVAEDITFFILFANKGLNALDTFAIATYFPKHAAGRLFIAGGLQISKETLLGCTALIVAILRLVHGKLKEFFIIFAAFPTILFHFLDKARKFVGIVALRVCIGKLKAFLLGKFDDFGRNLAGQLAALAENHAPNAVVHHRVAGLAH